MGARVGQRSGVSVRPARRVPESAGRAADLQLSLIAAVTWLVERLNGPVKCQGSDPVGATGKRAALDLPP